jgi:hypothetical protein
MKFAQDGRMQHTLALQITDELTAAAQKGGPSIPGADRVSYPAAFTRW